MNVFWNEGDVLFSVYDVTNKNSSSYSNCIADVVMWPKFGISSISMREIIIPQFYEDLTRKINFLRDALGWSSIIWDWR